MVSSGISRWAAPEGSFIGVLQGGLTRVCKVLYALRFLNPKP